MRSNRLIRSDFWRFTIFQLVILVGWANAAAQNPSPTPTPQASPTSKISLPPDSERNFLKNILRDQKAIWTSPFRLRDEDARWLVPFGATTAALIATDRRTAGSLGDGRTQLDISRGVSYAGSLYTTGGIAGVCYLVGRQAPNPRLRETGLLGAEALINSVIVYSALKQITQRPRPLEDGGSGRFFRGGESFPSGHATNAWSLATIVAHEYQDRPLIHYGAYAAAAAVSISRFTGRKHFLSDILVGSVLGYGIGHYVYRTRHDPALDSTDGSKGSGTSKFFPDLAPVYRHDVRVYGVMATWRF
jgi:membrane-associated phospholipid phosphatase